MTSSYTVAPHLEYFNVPLSDFTAARPEFEAFGIGGYIFSQNVKPTSPPRILLLQRALTDSMPGCWEGPGGASEPEEDRTLLDGVVREVLEESGLHVSRIVELVAIDSWVHKRRDGQTIHIAKYSFIVDVHEAFHESLRGDSHVVHYDEIPVQLEASEHRAFAWAVEEDVQASMESITGKYSLPLPSRWHQGSNILRAFELFRNLKQ
ncbi:hypothetical protein N7478_012862 [Penicillium angulare]|uniref:uncharacterized protein n=1 Tax=Penicillium angulare TaxID=116970 RepID=UPI00253F95D7|nr:uncharacterized protein N7478_012862 [Penicillium angulare]KAJ5256758.1 hypothetical protein N7478_012862 [Penicillium angulare]